MDLYLIRISDLDGLVNCGDNLRRIRGKLLGVYEDTNRPQGREFRGDIHSDNAVVL